MKMDLTWILLVFTTVCKFSVASGLQCYFCIATLKNEHDPLCEHFDQSAKYIRRCDSSTMCYTRITSTQFGTTIYERGCAKQTIADYQEHINGKWLRVKKIFEAYDEGCMDSPGDEVKVTRTKHCYCKGQLCNRDLEAGVVKSSVYATARRHTSALSNIARPIATSVFAIGLCTIGLVVLR